VGKPSANVARTAELETPTPSNCRSWAPRAWQNARPIVGRYTPPAQIPLSRGAGLPTSWVKTRAALSGDRQGETTMLFTILCSFSAGLVVFCILNRVHKGAIEIAVKLAVREIEKEYEGRNLAMKAQLAGKEEELKKMQDKAQQLVKLHSSMPPTSRVAQPAAKPPSAKEAAQARKERLKSEGLEAFVITRPFTDTSFGELLRTTHVERIEAKGS
jgi:hypothetical protein